MRPHLLGRQQSPLDIDRAHHDSGKRRWSAALGKDDVALPRTDHFVTRPGMNRDGNLVAHRSGWKKDGRFHPKHIGHAGTQLGGRRICVVPLVTQRCIKCGLSHGTSRTRLGVGVELVHVYSYSLF